MSSGGVCRYFLNNSCRYGDRCWYSHNTGGKEPSYNAYTYVKKHDGPSNSTSGNVATLSSSEIQGIVDKIAEETKTVEMGNMWPLTCLSVLKEGSNIPGWEDFSMEEIRAAAYAAGASNCFQEYVAFFESVKNKAKENRAIFLRPGRKAEEIVRGMLTKNDSQMNSNSALNSFSFASAQLPNSTSSFGSNVNFGGGSSFFNNDPAPGLFAQAAKTFNSPPSSQPFGQSQRLEPSSDSVMETMTETASNPPANTVSFQQNVFGQVQQPSQSSTISYSLPASTTIFPTGQPAPASLLNFGAIQSSHQPPMAGSALTHGIYTRIEDLTTEELEQFRATTFMLDKLPLRPPPQELC